MSDILSEREALIFYAEQRGYARAMEAERKLHEARIQAQAAEIERLRGKLAKAVDALHGAWLMLTLPMVNYQPEPEEPGLRRIKKHPRRTDRSQAMSYDMHIGEESFGITYNVSPMFYAAMPDRGIRCHYGMTGADAVFPLRRMREYMEDNREELEVMNPVTGLGDYDTALQFVTDLINASIRNADQIWDGD